MSTLNCYSSYTKKGSRALAKTQAAKRKREQEEAAGDVADSSTNEASQSDQNRRIRSRPSSGHDGRSSDTNYVCIICNYWRETTGDRSVKLYRLAEDNRTSMFLSAISFFKDDVTKRCVFLNSVGDVWANDVRYHNNCLKKYLKVYNDSVETLLRRIEKTEESATIYPKVGKIFDDLNFSLYGYSVSYIQDEINQGVKEEDRINNRRVKTLLLKHFGDSICFTYPTDKKLSQMVYSSNLLKSNVVEAARQAGTKAAKSLSDELLLECKEYDFGLKSTYCTSEDLALSMQHYTENRPQKWLAFFKRLFPNTSNTNTKEWLA